MVNLHISNTGRPQKNVQNWFCCCFGGLKYEYIHYYYHDRINLK
ncbi:hypothetical protein AABM17_1694 [Neisseria musculi]|uniref:Uncharacterized protein n=1 Tax=Neisseria musculi TaxID=1815583 RepID=A0A7H1MD26_9NEIS|nr:hypothetical protein H7A79_1693 [Neisseria musculi]